MNKIKVGDKFIGEGAPVYFIAEIGINHNGSLDFAKKIIDDSVKAGCHAVKFQKRTPEICVPKEQWEVQRETPWGIMSYIEYKHKVEFGEDEFKEVDRYCKEKGIDWFASCWDLPSVDFIEQFNPVMYKAASASLTDLELLKKMQDTGKPLMISTGMSTWEEIQSAVDYLGEEGLMIAHSTSSYPAPVEELNLKMIHTLMEKFPKSVIGYSGHEVGLAPTYASVALGAKFIERHVTLDRAMWGSDHAASVEMHGVERLMSHIKDIESALGDGVKKVYESEMGPRKKLRKVK